MASRPIVGASRLYLPRFEGPLDLSMKAVQLRSLLGRQQFNQVQLQRVQAAQQAEQEEAALDRRVDALIANAGGDIRATLPKIRALSPGHWKQWKGWFADYDRKDAEAKMAAIDLGTKRSGRMAELTQGVHDQASRDAAIQKGVQEQLIDEERAQRWLSMPYDPAKIKALQKSALTTQQFFTHERNRVNAERQQQQDARNAPEKVYDFLARTMGTVRSQTEWTAKRNFVQARLKRMGVSGDYLDLIPEQYSPQAAQQMKELGTTPGKERVERRTATEIQIELYQKDPELYEQIFDRVGIRSERQMRLKIIEAAMRLSESVSGQVDEKVFAKKLAELSSLVGVSLENQGQPQAGKTATREEVEAFAQSKGISYKEAAGQLRAKGYTIQ